MKSPSPRKAPKRPGSEEELLDLLVRELPSPAPDVLHGIGDDCAVIQRSKTEDTLDLLKTDALVEGIHFSTGTSLSLVGWKALCRPISDIAAMGGTPKHATVTVAAPAAWGNAEWRALYRGLGKAGRSFRLSIVGGETVRSPGPIFLSVSLTGTVQKKHLRLRSGARPGDLICVTGKLGGSFASGRHLRFHPRLTEGAWLGSRQGVTAMMDLSDGLGSDLPKLASASACSFELQPERLPRHRGCSLQEALTDGEDYELLVTIDSKRFPDLQKGWKTTFPKLSLTRIGVILPSSHPSPAIPAGYDHLASARRTG